MKIAHFSQKSLLALIAVSCLSAFAAGPAAVASKAPADSAKASAAAVKAPAAAAAEKAPVVKEKAPAAAEEKAPAVAGKESSKVTGKTCDDIKAAIAAKLDAKGVKNYTLDVKSKDEVKDAKVVGSCEGGAKKIVYARK